MVKKKTKSSKVSSKKKIVHKTKAKASVKQDTISVNKNVLLGAGVLIIVVAVVWALSSTTPNVSQDKSVSPKASFDMYVMSKCPYGVQAETEMIKAIKST